MKTLVVNGPREINGRQYHHGDELEPNSLSQKNIDRAIDAGWLKEYPDRRSLYRIFHVLSGCKEQERLASDELTELCLPQ
jgi:hypothetical protein